MKYLEIAFWRVAQWLIKRDWGCDCTTRDMTDFPDIGFRCSSCRAREVVEWIDYHIEIIKM